MIYDGIKGEKFAVDFLDSYNICSHIKHKPYDLLLRGVDGEFIDIYIEVKSTLLMQQSTRNQCGRYECWGKQQLDKMKKDNVWVMFVIQTKTGWFCQGFLKSKNLPDKNKFSILEIEAHPKLMSVSQFKRYLK